MENGYHWKPTIYRHHLHKETFGPDKFEKWLFPSSSSFLSWQQESFFGKSKLIYIFLLILGTHEICAPCLNFGNFCFFNNLSPHRIFEDSLVNAAIMFVSEVLIVQWEFISFFSFIFAILLFCSIFIGIHCRKSLFLQAAHNERRLKNDDYVQFWTS